MVFKKDKDREKGAKLIQDEAKKISAMFLRLSHATNPKVELPMVLLIISDHTYSIFITAHQP